ncbi:uncharacterized protein LOC135395756 [Ornithodoros turicata]|uniref:uncharacterized protein LOC135395756 n=1 Tax=Ornithodoros turicata TaxID=34597 RepID=UPI0031396A57
MTRVPFGAASSPFLLAATLRHHFDSVQHKYPAATESLRHAFYVDDLIVGATLEEDAFQIYREAVAMLQEAVMYLRKWCSNSPTLSRQFCQDGIAYDTVSSQVTVKVLGLHWHRPTDEVTFTMNGISSYLAIQPITKRTTLHGVARIFDPLGYLSRFTIRARLVFQSLWAPDEGWDDALQAPHLMQWADWCSELPLLNSIRLPRLLPSSLTSSDGNDEIHVFADASPRAYEAAIYLRTFDPQEQSTASLLLTKARVAPVKSASLPRLELLACLIAARLAAHARKMPLLFPAEFRAEFWIDSTVALHWITSAQSRTPVFVQNRVTEIRRLTTDSAWQHCKSRDNPADLLTRGIPAHRLQKESLWWHGPPWLSQPRDNSEWSDRPPSPPPSIEDAPLPSMCNAASAVRPPPVFSLDRYGTLSRMLRVTAWVTRFIKNAHPRKSHNRGPLTASEIAEAELYWVRQVQEEVFHETLAVLRPVDPLLRSSRLAALRPFLDSDQILRVGGRLAELLDSDSLKHPIILPNTHLFTHHTVMHTHVRLCHAGVQTTLLDLRSCFWILKGRQAVKCVVAGCLCLVCRRMKFRPEHAPFAPLPRDRITESGPFHVIEVDFCGPLYAKQGPTVTKSYVALFACAVTRAVHLELVMDMTTSSFLLAFRRFIVRRGVPSVVYSDNARTFQICAGILALLPAEDVQNFAANRHHLEVQCSLRTLVGAGGGSG